MSHVEKLFLLVAIQLSLKLPATLGDVPIYCSVLDTRPFLVWRILIQVPVNVFILPFHVTNIC